MPGEKPAYHHGDLRSKLIETAVQCIETDGVSKLSLRKVAGRIGVSHNAPYMHFASKDALLDAVITHGFLELRAALSRAGGDKPLTAEDWRERVKHGFGAYITFARDRPGLYALMHVPRQTGSKPGKPQTQASEADRSGPATLDGLAATLKTGQRLGLVRSGEVEEIALWVWSTLHGLASLTSDERLAFAGRSPQAVTDAVLDHLMEALVK